MEPDFKSFPTLIPRDPLNPPTNLLILPTLSLPHSGSTARALRVAAHSAQPTLAKSSERSSLISRPEGLVAGASPSILDWTGWAGGPGERNLGSGYEELEVETAQPSYVGTSSVLVTP